MKAIITSFVFLLLLGCDPQHPAPNNSQEVCSEENSLAINEREFGMGFTTWPYDATAESVDDTYDFIQNNASIYAEHIDNRIPWNALINDEALPSIYVNDIQSRSEKRLYSKDLLLSVSILNTLRTDLIEDYEGNTPSYNQLDDAGIVEAYVRHLNYLIERLSPQYLLIAIESNELLINSPDKWEAYKRLMSNVSQRIRSEHPNIALSESMTLHNWFRLETENASAIQNEISTYLSQYDFAAISFYPFFKNLGSTEEFQAGFDFLHDQITIPIAFVETAMIAENLEVEGLNLSIEGSVCIQEAYLNSLLSNAANEQYEFIIWWAHRDFDALWETFDPSIQDLGKIWRDTGLLDESGNTRPAYEVWNSIYNL